MVAGLRARASDVFRVFAFTLSLFPVASWVIVVCRVTDGVFLLSLICHFAAIFFHSPCFYSSTDYTDYTVFRILIRSLNTNDTDLTKFLLNHIFFESTDCTDFTEIGTLPCEALDNRLISVIS